MNAALLSETISTSMAASGYLLRPLMRTKSGKLIWPRFLPHPQSHMLIVSSPRNAKVMRSAVRSVISEATVPITHINSDLSPLRSRALISRLNDGLANGTHRDSMLVIIDGLASLLEGIRRTATRERASAQLRTLMTIGPNSGVHVILNQVMDDAGSQWLNDLRVDWEWVATIGGLTAISSEIVMGDGSAASIPLSSKIMMLRTRINDLTDYSAVTFPIQDKILVS